MVTPFPRELTVCDGHTVPIEQVEGLDELGHWSESEQVVRLRAEQPEPGKTLILIHEMMHMAETQLIARGVLGRFYNWVIRPIWGERLVEAMSSFLWQWMALSGLLTTVSPEDAQRFIDNHIDEWGDEATTVEV